MPYKQSPNQQTQKRSSSRTLPFWVEDRIGEGEKRLWGHGWLRGDFMRRTGAGGVDLVKLTGKDLLSAVGCRQGFF